MLSIERQNLIRDELVEKKNVQVADLAERFGVSQETIRRDLKELEKRGIARRSYGGAVLESKVVVDLDYNYLANILVNEKKAIASIAASVIHPMDCIFVDFSTTCGQLTEYLGEIPVNVMTNSYEVVSRLLDKEKVSLISVGGEWDQYSRAFMGSRAVQNIREFHLDKAFISCRALSMERGISDRSSLESDVRKAIIDSANQVYLLVDDSKFDKIAFVRTDTFAHITAVITNKRPSDEWIGFFEENGIRYMYPGMETEEEI